MDDALDLRTRQLIYDTVLTSGRAPAIADLAGLLQVPAEAVRAALRRLAAGRVVVLQPESGELLMANPFAAVPTPFVVTSGSRSWWANCVWDALGVLAMLQADGRVETTCPECGERLVLELRDGALEHRPAVGHFAVPARAWWQDIVFT